LNPTRRLIALGAELDIDPGRLQAVLLQITGVLIDDALNIQ